MPPQTPLHQLPKIAMTKLVYQIVRKSRIINKNETCVNKLQIKPTSEGEQPQSLHSPFNNYLSRADS